MTAARGSSPDEHGRPASGAGGRFGPSADQEPEPVVIRDKRRVTPFGPVGQARSFPPPPPPSYAPPDPPGPHTPHTPPAGDQPPADSPAQLEVIALSTQLAERTADLQRLKAEYDNYRRRVERDRQVGAEQATAKVLGGLLATLDDIDRAEAHGDLDGPFRTVAESVRSTLTDVGLERFGQQGDPFDPQIHEALLHSYQPGLDGPTCIEVYRPGYRFAGRVLRAAQVVVAEPPAPEESADGRP